MFCFEGDRRMKRVLAVALSILALCFALPVRAESPDDADALRAFLQLHYSMTILTGKECYSQPWDGYSFMVSRQGGSVFQDVGAGNDRFSVICLVGNERRGQFEQGKRTAPEACSGA